MSRQSFLRPVPPVQPRDRGHESHCYLARLPRRPETSREEHSAGCRATANLISVTHFSLRKDEKYHCLEMIHPTPSAFFFFNILWPDFPHGESEAQRDGVVFLTDLVAEPETDQEDDRARREGQSHRAWLPEGFFCPPGNIEAGEGPRWGQRGEALQSHPHLARTRSHLDGNKDWRLRWHLTALLWS